MEKNYQSQKVILNDSWYDELLKAVDFNNNNTSNLSEENEKVILERNKRIQDKLDKFKKVSDKNEVYYYFFPRELKDLFWILLENFVNNSNETIDEE